MGGRRARRTHMRGEGGRERWCKAQCLCRRLEPWLGLRSCPISRGVGSMRPAPARQNSFSSAASCRQAGRAPPERRGALLLCGPHARADYVGQVQRQQRWRVRSVCGRRVQQLWQVSGSDRQGTGSVARPARQARGRASGRASAGAAGRGAHLQMRRSATPVRGRAASTTAGRPP